MRHRILTHAASAPGQRKVSGYFLTESEQSQYVRNFLRGAGFDTDDSNILPDLAKNRSPSYIVIDSSSSSSDDDIVVCSVEKKSGPQHISSPVRHDHINMDNPSLSPINTPPPTNQN